MATLETNTYFVISHQKYFLGLTNIMRDGSQYCASDEGSVADSISKALTTIMPHLATYVDQSTSNKLLTYTAHLSHLLFAFP